MLTFCLTHPRNDRPFRLKPNAEKPQAPKESIDACKQQNETNGAFKQCQMGHRALAPMRSRYSSATSPPISAQALWL